jgi:uncharacterized membrane protein
MEYIGIILVIGIIGYIILAPIFAFTRITALEEKNRFLTQRTEELEDRLSVLEKHASTPSESKSVAIEKTPVPVVPPPSPVTPAQTIAPPLISQSTSSSIRREMPAQPSVPPPVLPVPNPKPIVVPAFLKREEPCFQKQSEAEKSSIKPAFNWERFIGVNLAVYIGGFALFLFVAFGLKYSFDKGWISPILRASMGYVLGTGLIGGGLWLFRREYGIVAKTLCATGVVSLYAVTYICRSVYHFELFSPGFTFGLMVMITAGAFMLSVKLDALVVAILGMLGGFLTPVLVSTGQDNPVVLFTYIALLDIGLLAVVMNRKWGFLTLLAALGTVGMEWGWAHEFFVLEKMNTAHCVFLGFSILFLIAVPVAKRFKQAINFFSSAAMIPAAFALGFAVYLIFNTAYRSVPGAIFTFIFVADLCVLLLVLWDKRLLVAQIFGGMATFIVLELWLSFSMQQNQIYWALGGTLGYAILNSAFPILFRRLNPDVAPAWWTNGFPLLALILNFTPIFSIPNITWLIWPCVVLIDMIALGLALVTRSILAVVAALLVSLLLIGGWILRLTPTDTDISTILLVIGCGAVFLFGMMMFAGEKIIAQLAGEPEEKTSTSSLSLDVIRELPALGAGLPFLLLAMVVIRVDVSNPSLIFGLAAVLCSMIIGLGSRLKSGWLVGASLVGVLILEHCWHFQYFYANRVTDPLYWYGGFYLLFALVPFIFWSRLSEKSSTWIAAGLSGPLHYYMIHSWIKQYHSNDFMGLVPGVFAFISLLGLAVTIKRIRPTDPKNAPVAWCGGVALFFITLIMPVQFEHEWITLGWALEGTALLWLFHRVPHPGLRLTGLGLLCAAFIRLGLNPAVLEYQERTGTPIWNWYLYAYSIGVICLGTGARLLAAPRNKVANISIPPLLYAMAICLAFLLVNIEIADYFSTTQRVTFEFSGNLPRDMAYTIAWSVFAFGLLILGLWKSVPALRYTSWALLGVTIIKLFFHDLANLGPLYRLGALVSVAIIAILAAIVYQRYLNHNRTKNPVEADKTTVENSVNN